jgi:hypothetical protein
MNLRSLCPFPFSMIAVAIISLSVIPYQPSIAANTSFQKADSEDFSTPTCYPGESHLRQLAQRDPQSSLTAEQRVESAYENLSKQLSPDVREKLCLSEKSWIEYVADKIQFIKTGRSSNDSLNDDPVSEKDLNFHANQIESSEQSVGDLKFVIVSFYRLLPLWPDTGVEDGRVFQLRTSSFPQIEKPKNQSEILFNTANERYPSEKMDKRPDGDFYNHDDSVKIEAIEVSPDLIQFSAIFDEYPHGAAHGSPTAEHFIWLRKEGRKLVVEDIFERDAKWVNVMAADNPNDQCNVDFKDVTRWVITKDGLKVSGRPWDCMSYMGNPDFYASWENLKHYLKKESPLSLPPSP